jgi:uncharacterized protein
MRPYKIARYITVLATMWLCSSCAPDQSSPSVGVSNPRPATSESESERKMRLARAAADAVEAGHALARSIKLDNARNSGNDIPASGGATPDSQPVADDSIVANVAKKPIRMSKDGYRDLDWLEMMPKDEIEALENPTNAIQISHVGNTRGKQYGSFRIIDELDGQKVQVAGYVVPLEADDQGNLTEFFFVPFYGACIHVPPPPPNQIVYAKLGSGIKTPEIWDPYWLKGVLRSRKVSNKVAGAAYTMEQATLVPWDG